MSRIYTVVMAEQTITAAQTDVDWLEALPGDDHPIKLRGMILSQRSEVGDAQEESLRFRILRLAATVTSGSGGTDPDGVPADPGDAADNFTEETGNTTVATTSGATVVFAEFAWNIRNSPYEMWWPDAEYACKALQGSAIIVRQETTVVDDIVAEGTFYIEEE